MVSDIQLIWLAILIVLIVLFGVLSQFTLKMDNMKIRNTGFKILKAITFAATVAVGLVLIILVRQNNDAIKELNHWQ